jgi:hypothetical protein
MFRCSYTIIRERINSCLLKLQLLKQSIKIHRCVVNTVVMWPHILGPYWVNVCCTVWQHIDCFVTGITSREFITKILVTSFCTAFDTV